MKAKTFIDQVEVLVRSGKGGGPDGGDGGRGGDVVFKASEHINSLLSALSSATPKIASYPFTPLNPVVGTIVYDETTRIRQSS